MKAGHQKEPVPPDTYDADYFLNEVEGWQIFQRTRGNVLPERLSYCFAIGDIRPGMKVLDAGFGRGELLLRCCRAGASVFGIDYSGAAVGLACDTMSNEMGSETALVSIMLGDLKRLPFPDSYFDRVFAVDVVEHLRPWELDEALCEVRRTLAPGGRLIVHTMPNLWYYRFGYPMYRILQYLRGRNLPRDPRLRHKSVPVVHVNEQDPISLRKVLERNGFSARVWLKPVRTSGDEPGGLESRAKLILSSVAPLKLVFCSSIFAVAEPEGRQ